MIHFRKAAALLLAIVIGSLSAAAPQQTGHWNQELPGWQRRPWDRILQEQLKALQDRYGDQPLEIIVFHHGIWNRDQNARSARQKLEAATGMPVITLPNYGPVGDESVKADGTELDGRVRRDLAKTTSQYLFGRGKLRSDFVEAWNRILAARPGTRFKHVVFHSGSGINANTTERAEILEFLEKNPGTVDKVVFAMTHMKEETRSLLAKRGVQAQQIMPEDFVGALTKPAAEYIDPNGGANPLGLKSWPGWALKLGTLPFKTLGKHSLLNKQGEVRPELLKALGVKGRGPGRVFDEEDDSLPAGPTHSLDPGEGGDSEAWGGDAGGPGMGGPGGGPASPGDLGGIDFTSVQLRFLSEGGGSERVLTAAFHSIPSDPRRLLALNEQTSLIWDSFFTFLALPSSSFWVNLAPHEPDRMIDAEFALSDASRILMNSDLELKYSLGRLTHPDSSVGQRFWTAINKLQSGNPDEPLRLSFRVWVIPGKVLVQRKNDGILIVDSELLVQLESEYLSGNVTGEVKSESQSAAEAAYRSIVLPELQREVNQHPRYDELRQVFSARIMATWYEERRDREESAFGSIVDRGSAIPWRSKRSWNPREAFERYLLSVREGEYKLTKKTSERKGRTTITTIQSYFMGGVDFTHLELIEVSEADVLRLAPTIYDDVLTGILLPRDYRSPEDGWFGGNVRIVRAR